MEKLMFSLTSILIDFFLSPVSFIVLPFSYYFFKEQMSKEIESIINNGRVNNFILDLSFLAVYSVCIFYAHTYVIPIFMWLPILIFKILWKENEAASITLACFSIAVGVVWARTTPSFLTTGMILVSIGFAVFIYEKGINTIIKGTKCQINVLREKISE